MEAGHYQLVLTQRWVIQQDCASTMLLAQAAALLLLQLLLLLLLLWCSLLPEMAKMASLFFVLTFKPRYTSRELRATQPAASAIIFCQTRFYSGVLFSYGLHGELRQTQALHSSRTADTKAIRLQHHTQRHQPLADGSRSATKGRVSRTHTGGSWAICRRAWWSTAGISAIAAGRQLGKYYPRL